MGVGVGDGDKGKGVLIHSITDANSMPVVAITIFEEWWPLAASAADASSKGVNDS